MPGRPPATLLGLLLSLSIAHAAPTPPAQPDSGPGGSRAAHADLRQWHYGQGDSEFWLFTPVDPLPRSAPLVVFMHGWSVMQPDLYRAWIEHIVRRGAIVIYPRYQADLRTPAANFLDNAAGAIRQALVELQDGHLGLRADLQQVAYLGHSAGGLIATGLAASASARQLPAARAVMAVEPGRSQGPRWRQVPLPDLAGLSPGTLLLSVCGEEDNRVGCDDAQRIYREASRLPSTDKNLLLIRSDRHGSPPLLANHAMPTALRFDPRYPPSDNTNWLLHRVQERQNRRAGDGQGTAHDALGVDALDWYGTWKLFDALCDAAFSGSHRETALGGGPAQLSMGQWSDGTPVTPMRLLAP
ncbi:MAG: hypothetical protein GAK43_02584 [Stenotrophomonas maltophilia]|nr:MAG: hypothetical protein GAK43_02584 [Stenotrophomonas maltophilia]